MQVAILGIFGKTAAAAVGRSVIMGYKWSGQGVPSPAEIPGGNANSSVQSGCADPRRRAIKQAVRAATAPGQAGSTPVQAAARAPTEQPARAAGTKTSPANPAPATEPRRRMSP